MRARQRRALRAIEKELTACEPHLTVMFTIFGSITRDEEPAGKERLPGRRRLPRASPRFLWSAWRSGHVRRPPVSLPGR